MSLNPKIVSLQPIVEDEWILTVEMVIPDETTYELSYAGSANNTSIIHATVTEGEQSGLVIKALNFSRELDDNFIKVIAVNQSGEPEGSDETSFPLGGGH